MKFIEKIRRKQADIRSERQPVLAFLGDSVTHGCFELYIKNGNIEPATYMEKGYHEKVKKILGMLYPTVPVTMVNAGISGDNSSCGLERLERDVLSYGPDMVVVCYGLNDAMAGENGINTYTGALRQIFAKIRESGSEVIFMTPNVRSDNLSVSLGNKQLDDCALRVINNEASGMLKKYLDAVRGLCKEENVPLCDCNAVWNMLRDNEVDINMLLSNRINHPTEEMDWVFAYELVKTMLSL